MSKTTEFGRGLTYCLGLFLAHAERNWNGDLRKMNQSIWFNAASDHLYELIIPETLPKELQKRLKKFKEEMLEYGHGNKYFNSVFTEEDVRKAVDEAKTLLLLIDKAYGIKALKAEWS